jgi:hypothetical protein
MSRKDEAIVRDLLPDEEAIEAYYLAKGKTVPKWVQTALRQYWNSLPDERFPILAIRALRPHLEKPGAPKDLQDLFTRLVALSEVLDNLPENSKGHKISSSRVALATVAVFNLLADLERKYDLSFVFGKAQEVSDLEEWEKSLP